MEANFKGIRPIYSQYVVEKLDRYMKERNRPDSKFFCMDDTTHLIYYALEAGAKVQRKNFNYSVKDFLLSIDFQEYLLLLEELKKQAGFCPDNQIMKN